MQIKAQIPDLKSQGRDATFNMLVVLAVAVIGLVAIIFFGILGQDKFQRQSLLPSPGAEVDQQVQDLGELSFSDEIGDIEKDLNNTNIESLDQGISEVDASLSQF